MLINQLLTGMGIGRYSVYFNIYPMKQFTLYLVCLLFAASSQAADRPEPQPKPTSAQATKVAANQGQIQFQFNNVTASKEHKDSVLIIFDRTNHTGAGVIYQVYAADEAHCITIPAVPAGKYYVTIQCLGLHHDRMEKTVTIRSQKSEKVRINLEASEEFSKDKVVIPVYHPDFANLTVLKTK